MWYNTNGNNNVELNRTWNKGKWSNDMEWNRTWNNRNGITIWNMITAWNERVWDTTPSLTCDLGGPVKGALYLPFFFEVVYILTG